MMTFSEMAFFHTNFMLQTPHEEDHSLPSTSLAPLLPSCSPQEFHGKRSFDICDEMNNHIHGEDDLSDDGSQLGERKKRLNMEQVKTLEKNFELANKLEPERKLQLARALGLQPRQIAIWFQNRRARWKTKKLEKDYELLKRQFEAAKIENDALQVQNQKLHAQIMAMKTREQMEPINLNKETEASSSNRSENSSEIKLDLSRTPAIDSPLSTNPTSRPFFHSSLRPNGLANPSRPEIHCPKIDNQTVKEESLCNMFGGLEDHGGLWPWLEQHHFN